MSDYVLIVLHKTDDSFAYYDVRTGEQIELIKTRAFPHEICLSPDRKRIYIAEMGVRGVESTGAGGHTIAVYDTKSRNYLSTIDTQPYDRPHGLATDRGKLFVTSESTQHLLIYDIKTEEVLHTVFLDQECAHMVSVAPDGKHAYTANIFSNSITEVDVESGQVIKHINVLERPEGMVFSPDGNVIYVVNRESCAVSVIDRKLGKQIDTIKTGNGPVRVVITPDGKRLVIPLFHSAAVQIVDTQTKQVKHTVDVGPHPAGTALSPDGKVAFISCEDENLIYVFSLETVEVISTITTGPGCDAMVCLYKTEIE
jgi:YVTN family beta-propeller protein